MTNTATINNSYATGIVTGRSYNIGGLAGVALGNVNNSYATGDVNGCGSVGGLVGNSQGNINNSYTTGNVIGTGDYTGGLVGLLNDAFVTNSYATGNVTGKTDTGGLAGYSSGAITNSFAKGNVTGTIWVGGLIVRLCKTSGTSNYNQLFANSNVTGEDKIGNLIGGINNTSNGTSFGTINITNSRVINRKHNIIGFEGDYHGNAYESGQMATWLENIKEVKPAETNLQVGIMGDESSRISFDTGFEFDLNSILTNIKSDKAYSTITQFMSTLSAKATDLGSISNRLESSLESIAVNMQNLGDSLSTVKDVDMAEVSSEYIKKQILQQASATLLATANQSPAIALQLI